MIAPMLALTLWPEWAWMIASGVTWPDGIWLPKLVENRGWHPGERLPVGATLAIHAGKHLGGRSGSVAADEAVSSVLYMFRLANPGLMLPSPGFREAIRNCPRSAIVCTATIAGYDTEQRTGWDVPDAVHWRLRDVRVPALPVPCPGARGLWPVPDAVRDEVRARLAA